MFVNQGNSIVASVTSNVIVGRGGDQIMDYSRIQADLATFSNIVQNAIGEVMLNGFGVETTDSANRVIFWALIVFSLLIGLRVRRVRARGEVVPSRDRQRRFGLDRYRQI